MRKYLSCAVAFVSALPIVALADVPSEASAAVTALVADAGDFIGSLWPVLIAVTVALLFMKLFKKGTSRAT